MIFLSDIENERVMPMLNVAFACMYGDVAADYHIMTISSAEVKAIMFIREDVNDYGGRRRH